MQQSTVNYLGTQVIEIIENFTMDRDLIAEPFIYIRPSIKADNSMALFEVSCETQFEGFSVPYRFTTKSKFQIVNVIYDCEKGANLLKDYCQIAYSKHLLALKVSLYKKCYLNKINFTLKPPIDEEYLETLIKNAYSKFYRR